MASVQAGQAQDKNNPIDQKYNLVSLKEIGGGGNEPFRISSHFLLSTSVIVTAILLYTVFTTPYGAILLCLIIYGIYNTISNHSLLATPFAFKGISIEIENNLILDCDIGEAPLYFFPVLRSEDCVHGMLLWPAKVGYERCGIVDVRNFREPLGYGTTTLAAHKGWVEDLEMRAKKRCEEEGDFEVNYHVGPPHVGEGGCDEEGMDLVEWREYDEFDGMDYTFRIY